METSGHVYLIDDDSDIRMHVGALLRLLGYDVKTFAEATAFVELDMLEYPAVVILDMSMPGMSGLQVHRCLLQSGCPATILYLSGNSERQDIIDAMKAGAADFLWKPVSRETLALAVSDAMTKSKAVSARFAQQAKLRAGLDQLSAREREVFEMMVSGLPNRQAMPSSARKIRKPMAGSTVMITATARGSNRSSAQPPNSLPANCPAANSDKAKAAVWAESCSS